MKIQLKMELDDDGPITMDFEDDDPAKLWKTVKSTIETLALIISDRAKAKIQHEFLPEPSGPRGK